MSQIPSAGRTVHSESRLVGQRVEVERRVKEDCRHLVRTTVEYRDRVVEAAEREQTEVHVEKSNRVGRDARRHCCAA